MSIKNLVGVSVDGVFNLRNELYEYVPNEMNLSRLIGSIYDFTVLIEKEQNLHSIKEFSFEAVPDQTDRINLIVVHKDKQVGYMTLCLMESGVEVAMKRQFH